MKLRLWIIASGLVGMCAVASAADFKEGFEAAANSDYRKAAEIWQKLAEKGDAEAQFNLGALYHSGAAGHMNEQEAVKWYQKAAANGNYRAQEYLAAGYREGWFGLPKDEARANFWEDRLSR